MSSTSQVPYRQIRAHYDSEYITVYQAYHSSIAKAAVQNQKLNASPDFRPGRMTWVKPSWCWMMYRAGYSYKDSRQAHILALKMKHEHFIALLDKGILTTHQPDGQTQQTQTDKKEKVKSADVKIQWDPERTARLEILPYRSIQIGIPGALSGEWANEWIAEIEDVTDRARELKKVLDEEPNVTIEDLVDRGLLPSERPFPVSDSIISKLRMAEESKPTP